jgi:SAM-dependent methyltransferase
MASVLYRSPFIYDLVMWGLYRQSASERYREVAELLVEYSSVLDVCCGPAHLASYLDKNQQYLGLDISDVFVSFAKRRGIPVQRYNLWKEELPIGEYDVIVLQASLYQFAPKQTDVIDKMIASAKKAVLVTEPIRNLSQSRWKWISSLSRKLTRPEGGGLYLGERFNKESMQELIQPYKSKVSFVKEIAKSRELAVLFEAGGD